MYVPRAMYSLRMSFWTVPLTAVHGMPRSSATTRYIASSVAAVALIVIDVETRSSGMPSSSACMSSTVSIATPDPADLARGARRIGVDAHLRRQVERDREPGLARGQQQAKSRVGLGRRAESGVLAHGPQTPAIHRRLNAARERETPGSPRSVA